MNYDDRYCKLVTRQIQRMTQCDDLDELIKYCGVALGYNDCLLELMKINFKIHDTNLQIISEVYEEQYSQLK